MGANGRLVHVEVRGEGEEIGVVGVDGQECHQYHGQHTFPSSDAFHVCPLQKLQSSDRDIWFGGHFILSKASLYLYFYSYQYEVG